MAARNGMNSADLLDSPATGTTEGNGLGLVSTLLDLHESSVGEGPTRGRQWFPEGVGGGLVQQRQGVRPPLTRGEGTSQKIRQSLSRLDEVLSTSHSLGVHVSTESTLSCTFTSAAPTPARLGVWGDETSGQGEESMMDNTEIRRDLCLAPTPVHNTTRLTLIGQAGYYGSQLLEETVLGEDSTVMEDPTQKVGGDLIMAFHREFSTHCRPSQSLELVAALEKCCEVQSDILTEFEKQTRLSVDQLQSELRMEMATWQLLYVLSRDRVEEGETREASLVEMLWREGTSDKEVADHLFTQDSSVRQAQLVVDWLEGLARVGLEQYPVKTAYFTDNVCLENTLHDLIHGIDCNLLVTEMDPDAPSRQQRKLSELDTKDELSLNKHLFACIRAGQLDEALGMCVNSGQPLKALMLEGWKLHHDPNLARQGGDKLESIEGNGFRDIWKASCWHMLDEPTYDMYEKAMLATLSGNVGKVLPVCQTWYDYVWAYFKALVDVQVEKALRSRSDRELVELPSEYWSEVSLPHQIFQRIEMASSTGIQEQSQSHFHTVQKFIILDDVTGLVDEMVTWLPSQPSMHRLRFMAHVGLVVRGLGRATEESKVDAILEAYVKALTDGHYQSTVALYAAQLPADTQVHSYAYLLAGVQQEDQQRHCLELGKEAGLDIAMVTKAVVENIREIGESVEQSAGPVELGHEVQLTQLDQRKIKAINWLVYEEAQRMEAIKQANTLICQFLTARKFSAAQAVFQKIPPDSVQVVTRLWQQQAGPVPVPHHVASDLTELQALQTYLEAKDAFNVWFQYFHHKKPSMPAEPTAGDFHERVAYDHSLAQYKLEYEQWQLQANLLSEEASSRLFNVLVFPTGWMSDHLETEGSRDAVVVQQLQALRQTCIPEVCFLLHSVLDSSTHYKKCLQISDVVTSDKYMLYKNFRNNELRQLLMLLQRSALKLSSDPTTDEMGYSVI